MLCGDDLTDHTGHRLARLVAVHTRQLLQIHLSDQRPVYFRFELLKIKLLHVMPSVLSIENWPFYFIQINETVSSSPGLPADHTLFWPSDERRLRWPTLRRQAKQPYSAP